MRREDARKLLGGFATGTLTGAEQEALFTAALEDQELFDEMAREQPLRDLLRDPAASAQLLAALDGGRPRRWWMWKPAAVLAMTGVAALAVVVMRPKAPAPVREVAIVSPAPAPQPSAHSAPAPAPQPKRKVIHRPAAPPPPAADATTLAEAPRADTPAVAGGVAGGVGGVPKAIELQAQVARQMFESQSGAASQLRAPAASPRSLFYGAGARPLRLAPANMSADARPLVAVRYSFLRRESDDEFAEVDPGELKQGDTLALRFTSNTNGYLSIAGASPVALTAMQPYTSPPLPPDQTDISVVFSRQPRTVLAIAATPVAERRGREIYVVNTLNTPALGFIVTLTRK